MDDETFRSRLRDQAAGWCHAELIELKADRQIEDGRTDEEHVEEALEWLRPHARLLLPSQEPARAAARAAAPIPPDRATESLLLDKLRWWIEDVRERLFDRREPPFADVDAAKPWLTAAWKHRQRATSHLSDEQVDRRLALGEQIEALRGELEELEDAQLVLQFRTEQTPCWLPVEERRPTGISLEDLIEPEKTSLTARVLTGEVWEEIVGVNAGPYRIFGRELRRMSQATGIFSVDLADLVLTGRKPHLPPATLGSRGAALGPERPDGSHTHSHLEIRLNSPLSYRELRQLHAQIREIWTEAYKPPPDVRLLLLVADLELGADANTFSQEGWRRVGAALGRLGYSGGTDPRALATRYGRYKGQIDY